jgi:hypothetical protein
MARWRIRRHLKHDAARGNWGMAKTHGRSRTTEYRSWASMIVRCENRDGHAYDRYGGRGVRVCRRWRMSFESFLKDMGPKPPGYSLERRNNNGSYTPKNCYWASRMEQQRNRRGNRYVKYRGRRMCLAEVVAITGIKYTTLHARMLRGMSIADAVRLPIKHPPRYMRNGHMCGGTTR